MGFKFTPNQIVLISYSLAFYAGWYVISTDYFDLFFGENNHTLYKAFVGDIVATVVVYLTSMMVYNSSVYDAYWSVAPMLIVPYYQLQPESQYGDIGRQSIVLFIVLVWGARLTWNCQNRWENMDHEDWRYIDIKNSAKSLYFLTSFFAIHFFPTLLVFAGLISTYVAMISNSPLNIFDLVGSIVGLLGIVFEGVADEQLRVFVEKKKNGKAKGLLKSGLWKYSRHPNYLGEVLLWWSLSILAFGATWVSFWNGGDVKICSTNDAFDFQFKTVLNTITPTVLNRTNIDSCVELNTCVIVMIATVLGGVVINSLFYFISLNLVETRMKKRYGTMMDEYMKQTPAFLLLWFSNYNTMEKKDK